MKLIKCMLFVLAVASLGITGCKEKGPLEKAGEAADKAVEKSVDAAKEAGEKAKDAVEK